MTCALETRRQHWGRSRLRIWLRGPEPYSELGPEILFSKKASQQKRRLVWAMNFSGILTDPMGAQAQQAFRGCGDAWLRPGFSSFQFIESQRPMQPKRSSRLHKQSQKSRKSLMHSGVLASLLLGCSTWLVKLSVTHERTCPCSMCACPGMFRSGDSQWRHLFLRARMLLACFPMLCRRRLAQIGRASWQELLGKLLA